MAIEIPLDAARLASTRLALSPAAEVIGVLRHGGRHPYPHARRWYDRAVRRLDRAQLDHLQAVVSPGPAAARTFPVPLPEGPHDTIATAARRIAGPAGAAIAAFFEVAIAEDWGRVRAVLESDISHHADAIARGGVGQALDSLDPSIHWTGQGLRVDGGPGLTDNGTPDTLVLVPCTSQVEVGLGDDASSAILVYPARGRGRLSESAPRTHSGSLSALIGPTRAELLRRLDVPRSTYELSVATCMSTATISYHLKVLTRSGLATKARRGRHVLYRRQPHAEALVALG